MECPICLNGNATVTPNPAKDANLVECPQCLKFLITRRALLNLESADSSTRSKISAWLVEYQSSIFTAADVDLALQASVPGLIHRANRMLQALNLWFPRGGEFYSPSVYGPLTAIGWNRNGGDTRYMLEAVLQSELGFLTDRAKGHYRINAKGLLHLEGVSNPNSSVGFCAMWFNEDVKPLWINVIEPAIRSAGYEPLRIDSKRHNGKIDDEIMASIRGSRFVVSDFTGSRGGVYYEAGFAHGLDLPVIFMCREGDDLHFDIRQYNCIFWKADALPDAQERLKNRILATLGQGPLKV